jgi:hypothetical protein
VKLDSILAPRPRPNELLTGPAWEVRDQVSINTNVENAWKFISTPGMLEESHPYCRRNSVRKWPGPESDDDVEYYSGILLRREFSAWLEGEGYDLWAGPQDRITTKVSWRLHGTPSPVCTLKMVLTPVLPQPPFKAAFLERYPKETRPGLTRYLRSVVLGLQFRIETGESVQRNQFGAHPVFSPQAKTRTMK